MGYGKSGLGQAVRGTVQGDPPGGAGTQGAQHPHPRDPYFRHQGTERILKNLIFEPKFSHTKFSYKKFTVEKKSYFLQFSRIRIHMGTVPIDCALFGS